jgi:hypothetical protein
MKNHVCTFSPAHSETFPNIYVSISEFYRFEIQSTREQKSTPTRTNEARENPGFQLGLSQVRGLFRPMHT